MVKMKAAAVMAVKDVQIIEVDKPVVEPYEVLVKIAATSLCTVEQRSYLGIRNFGFPFIGGHECAGIVEEVGAYVQGLEVGDHVTPTFNYCYECDFCKKGQGTQCVNVHGQKAKKRLVGGSVIGGGMADYIVVPATQVCKLDPALPFEKAALTEPLACCIHSVQKARIDFADTVVIIGAGIMGILQTKLCKLRGARVVVSEVDEKRRQLALDNGADLVVNPLEQNLVEYVYGKTNGIGADVVINTTALSKTWEDAIEILAPYGRLLAYSSQHPDNPIGVKFGRMHNKEYEFIGTVSPTAKDFLLSSKLMSYGIVDVAPVISHVLPFEQAAKAYELACVPGTYRVVIKR